MLTWLKSLFLGPQPVGPPETLRAFKSTEPTISKDSVRVEDQALVVEANEKTTVSLFEVKQPSVEKCILTYRANAKAEQLEGKAYLEMQCRFPRLGDHKARGMDNALDGVGDWSPLEAQVYLAAGQSPDSLMLNMVMEGPGRVRMKDVEVIKTPTT